MADQKQLKILKSGVLKWNAWRTGHPGIHADLIDAQLFGADLSDAQLFGANLSGANLSRANLSGASLSGADLSGANLSVADLSRASLSLADLSGAKLNRADLSVANLRDANLRDADLSDANLSGADLSRADLSHTVLVETVYGNVDLRNATGLESCTHLGPSILDHRTLMRLGAVPLVFLRGCGLPDRLIEYLPSLVDEAIQFYSCFISYSTQDQDFADRLHADLQNNGVRCWFAPHDIQAGKKLHEQIDEAIRVYDKLLLILSPASMTSAWVQTEIAKARKRELREHRQMLFPLRLVDFETLRDWECFDADTGKDSAREIREYFIPDFSHWKTDHDAYTQVFDRLLKDLRAEKEARP